MAEGGRDSGRLTDSFIASSDVLYDLYCEVCADFNKHLEATGFCVECQDYLCEACVTSHGINRLSRNHVVRTKSQMPRQKPSAPPAKPTIQACTEKCELHPDRLVEYYCKDDRNLACTVCLVKHRQCQSVDHISDLSEHLLDSQDYNIFTTTLSDLKTKSKNVIKRAKDNTLQSETLCTDVSTALQELRGKLVKAFVEFEQNMKKQTDKLKSADFKKMKDIVDKGTDVLDEVEKISADLEILQSKKQLGQLFVRMTKLENRVQTLHKVLDDAEENNKVTAYKFEPETRVQEIIDDPTTIGNLSVQALVISKSSSRKRPASQKITESPTKSPMAKSSDYLKAEYITDITTKTRGDENTCWITGSVVLPGNKLILADRNNNALKLLNLQTSNVTSILNVSNPWDVAIITDDKVAVTLNDARKIAFVNVTSVLKLDRKMSVDGVCTGILHTNGTLFVAFGEPVKIEVMALDGTVDRTIASCDTFSWPSHMALGPGNDVIYVTDYGSGSVKKLSLGGVVQSEYEDERLCGVRGVIVDQQGRVLVCGARSWNILLLSSDLSKIKVLVDEIRYPCSISLCNSTGMLYVGKEDDDVRLYQLS